MQILIPSAVVLLALYWFLKPIWKSKAEYRRKQYDGPRVPKGWHEKNRIELDVTENYYHDN